MSDTKKIFYITEVPILQGLMGLGIGQGVPLTLRLFGPAVSLSSMIVLREVLGTKKTIVYMTFVIVLATIAGIAYGAFFS